MTDANADRSESHENDSAGSPKDRFVEALLEHRSFETPDSMDARIDRAMAVVRRQPKRSHVAWQYWALPVAALLAISMLIMPTTSSASAIVRSATRVANQAVDRQYSVILIPQARNEGDEPPPIRALLDVRDGDHMRVQITYPNGDVTVRGRSGDTSWEIRRDGAAVLLPSNSPWPRWIETPDGSLLVDSMASVLEELDDRFELTQVSDAKACGSDDLLEIRAVRRATSDGEVSSGEAPTKANPAERIEMCIDQRSNEVVRLEMFFPARNDRAQTEFAPPPNGDQPPPPPRGHGGQGGHGGHGEFGPPPHDQLRHPPRGNRMPPPPQSISFQRTETATFPSGWFDAPAGASLVDPPPHPLQRHD